MTTEQLKRELSRLDTDVRADLAKFLIDSLDPQRDPNAAEAWEAELQRRLDLIRSGDAIGEPAEVVMERLRKKHSRSGSSLMPKRKQNLMRR